MTGTSTHFHQNPKCFPFYLNLDQKKSVLAVQTRICVALQKGYHPEQNCSKPFNLEAF